MKCQGYLAGFSDYQDGMLSSEERSRFEGHRQRCPSCARYTEVFERSREVVRRLPSVEVSPEFRTRLNARIREERFTGRMAPGPQSSASSTGAVAAVALILAVVAWLPTLEPIVIETTLPAIAAAPPIRPPVRTRLGSTPFPRGAAQPVARDGFWGDANATLHEYSTLAGYSPSNAALVRTLGFE